MIHTIGYAKCILTGEHAVIRGHQAIVIPLKKYSVELYYFENNENFSIEESQDETLYLLFWRVLTEALEKLKIHIHEVRGNFFIKSNISAGTGLGFSAALCVAVTRWLIAQKYLAEHELFVFARGLEDLFHGSSSGVDIVGAMMDTILLFAKPDFFKPLTMKLKPCFILTISGEKSVTKKMVQQVNDLISDNPELSKEIDLAMQKSVLLALQALAQSDSEKGTSMLAKAVNLGHECFKNWNLITSSLDHHIQGLLNQGALAAKPTGAGGGGYVLSLWQNKASAASNIKHGFISVDF